MSKINFRILGDNIYNLLSTTVTGYTTLEFEKESFIKQVKSGIVEYDNLKMREETPINFLSDFYIVDTTLKTLRVVIPDNKESFLFEGNGLFFRIELNSFDDRAIEVRIKEMLKEMSDNFIKQAVIGVETSGNKASIWDNISETLYKNLVLNMRVNLKDVSIILNHKNNSFMVTFDEIDFSNQDGITRFIGLKIILKKTNDKAYEFTILEKCSFETQYNRDKHLIKLHTGKANFNIDTNVFQAQNDIIQERYDNVNRIKCFKKNLLSNYPKTVMKERNNYIQLWKYAITKVVKIRKYTIKRWHRAFDLEINKYEELAIEYYNNNNKDDNLLLMKKQLLIKYSKDKAEKLILQNKNKSNTNPLMNLFFMKKSSDEKPEHVELTNEEKIALEEVYSKELIKKFIKGKWYTFNFLYDKFEVFMTKLAFDISIQNFNLCFYNGKTSFPLSLNQLNYDFILNDRGDWFESYNMSIGDISNMHYSLCQGKTKAYLVKIKSYVKTDIEFGFSNLILNHELIEFYLLFSSCLQYHSWNHILIKNPRKKALAISEYTFTSIPFVSVDNNSHSIMLMIYSLTCKNPSNLAIDFEIKEPNTKFDIVSRNTILLTYIWPFNKYCLQFSNILCLISEPLVYFINELLSIKLNKNKCYPGNDYNKPIEDQTAYLDFKYDEFSVQPKLIIETKLPIFQVSFIENQNMPLMVFEDINFILRGNEVTANIMSTYLSISKYSNFLFTMIYNQYVNDMNNQKESENKNKNKNNELIDMPILIQIQKNIIEYNPGNSKLQLITHNTTMKSQLSSMNFSSESNLLTHYYQESQDSVELLKIENNLVVNFSTINNALTFEVLKPIINLDLAIIDNLINCISIPDLISVKSLSSSRMESKSNQLKFDIKIISPIMTFNSYSFQIEILKLSNITNHQSYNLHCLGLTMSSNKRELIKEIELNIEINLGSENECYYSIVFYYLKIYLSQQDITDLINSLNYKISMRNYNQITKFIESNEDTNQSKKQTTNMNINVRIPKWDIDFFLKEKEKLATSSGEEINVNIIQGENFELSYTIGKLLVYFWDFNNNQLVLISDNTVNITQKENKLIDYEDLLPRHQLSFSFKDKLLDIDITSIQIFLRADAFHAIYSYFINAIPFHNLYSQVKEMNADMRIKCLFKNSAFVLQTSFDNKETLIIQIDKFYSLFQSSSQNKFPFGELFVQMNSVRGEFVEASKQRKLFNSKNDFLLLKSHILHNDIDMSMILDAIVVNLSYKDIISFLKAYHINLYYFTKEKRIPPQKTVSVVGNNVNGSNKEKLDPQENDPNNFNIKLGIEIDKIDITLIDNLQSSYFPFLNITINKFSFDKTNNNVEIGAVPSVYSYNYISCMWEPTIEPVLILLIYKRTKMSEAKKRIISCFVQKDILINLSDMNISLTLGALSRWIERFLEEKRSYQESFEDSKLMNVGNQILITDDMTYISKISNNNVHNVSGDAFNVVYQGTTFNCEPGTKIDLEYLTETESNCKIKEIELKYSNKSFKIPIEKIGARMHKINDSTFFISEISVTKQLSIEICVYSPVVFHNKSQLGITIVFRNNQDVYYMVLPPKSKQGVPFNYLDSTFDIYFSNIYPNKNQKSLSVSEIINTGAGAEYKKNLLIESKFLLLKLIRNIHKVSKMVITAEYVIVNYLPCNLYVNCEGHKIKIKKCSAHEIDFKSQLLLLFSIEINKELFHSKIEHFFLNKDKVFFIQLTDKFRNSFFVTAMIYEKPTQKILVLYAEYLIKNTTNLNLKIKSKGKDNNLLCFPVESDVYLISSNQDINHSWFSLSPEPFLSNKIFLKDLLSEASEYNVKMSNKESNRYLNLNILTTVSYLPKTTISFTDMFFTVIFTINPLCKIHNLLENKWVFICTEHNKQEFKLISPLSSTPFHFFNLGKFSRVCLGIGLSSNVVPHEWTEPFSINQFDLLTCCVSNNIFNIEIRQNNDENNTDVFITKSTASNSKILINNQTLHQIAVYQKGNDSRMQIIMPESKEPFHLYSITNPMLTFIIGDKNYNQYLPHIKEPNSVHLGVDTLLHTESNGLKTHFIFYSVTKCEESLPEANQLSLNINLASICISLIGDNKYKDKKLLHYYRSEILLFELRNIVVQIYQKANTSLINKIDTNISLKLGSININNQISTYGKFATVLSNNKDPALDLISECAIYPSDKICSMKSLEFEISKLFIGIDPNFVEEMINFLNNIIYRMNIINFNVDEIFFDQDNINSNPIKEKELLIENYRSNSVLCNLQDFEMPGVKFNFELSKIGLKSLLRRHFNFNSFLSSILSNLAGETHSIKLKKYPVTYYLGTVGGLISLILNRYKRHLFVELNKIGIKGVFLGLVNFIKQKEQESDLVKIDRKRLPRPFYGQYKGIKRYDESHAEIYEMMINIFGGFTDSYYFGDGIKIPKGTIIFTTTSMLFLNSNNAIEKMIDYSYIKNVTIVISTVLIEFNKKLDNAFKHKIVLSKKDIAETICKKLKDAIIESGYSMNILE